MADQKQTVESARTIEDEHMMDLLEAALYVSGRPLDMKTLGSILETRSKKRIQLYARRLMEEYSTRNGALEIVELDDGRFVLQLKTQYLLPVKRLAIRPLLTVGPLKTLAYIAYRQPVVQSRIIAARGSQAYSHIRELKRLGLITMEKLGKTKAIRTTSVFADYFNLSHDARLMKSQLKALFDSVEKFGDKEEKGNS